MISVAIIAIAVACTTRGFISATQSRVYGRHLSVASFLAQDKLEEFKAAPYKSIVPTGDETVNDIYTRSCSVSESAGLKTINVTVTFSSGLSRVHSITLTTAKANL